MTVPITALTADGHLLLCSEAGTIVLTHEEVRVLAGRLSMDLSALNWRHLEGEYPPYVTLLANPEAQPEKNSYYVSTTQGASVRVTGPKNTLEEAQAEEKEWRNSGIEGLNGYALVIRDTLYGTIQADLRPEA